jgi:hypothetical protein
MDKDDMDVMDFIRDDLDAANERIKYLKKAYKELHRDTTDMMGEDARRIKVLEDALRIAADFRCEWIDCRRWTFKESDEYCYFHKEVIAALEVK